jgi:hypothetical protein
VFVVMAQIRWIAWSTFIPHSRMVWSRLPLARVCPSGLNTTASTELVWPLKGRPNGVGCAGGIILVNLSGPLMPGALARLTVTDDGTALDTPNSEHHWPLTYAQP